MTLCTIPIINTVSYGNSHLSDEEYKVGRYGHSLFGFVKYIYKKQKQKKRNTHTFLNIILVLILKFSF